MVLDVMGLGRSYLSESSLEPELQNDNLDFVDPIDESVMSAEEFMVAVAYQCEANMNAIDMAIAGTEYMALRETGQEMVWEGFSIQGIIDKAKQGVQWLWGQIQKFFKTVIDKFNSWRIDKFLEKYKKNAAGKKVAVTTKVRLVFDDAIVLNKEYPDRLVDQVKTRKDCQMFDYILKKLNSADFYSKLAKEADDVVKSYQVSAENAESGKGVEDVGEYMKKIAGRVFGEAYKNYGGKDNVEDASGFTKAMLEYYGIKGSDGDAVAYVVSADAACDFLKTVVKDKRAIKDAYDENKKKINDDLKNLKKFESSMKKFKVIPTDASKAVHNGVKVINKTGKWLTTINRAMIKAINVYTSLAKKAVVSAAALKTSDENGEPTTREQRDKAVKTSVRFASRQESGNILFDSIEFSDII